MLILKYKGEIPQHNVAGLSMIEETLVLQPAIIKPAGHLGDNNHNSGLKGVVCGHGGLVKT